jgi:hypothetical protein
VRGHRQQARRIPYWSGETRDWLKIKPAEVRERQVDAVRKGFERAASWRGVKSATSARQSD